ncbi:MAG: tRNA pseudouridine(13) synthase TruD [Candidatus Bathyarchaeota archaeon]|nr:tRNA pseudouridine(13) synthase TruD [Candidatus Bathyarchaeota archaeon]
MADTPQLDLTLPYITPDEPGIGGVIRARPELFSVVEVPAYDPLGYGDHIYLNITKRGRTTRDTQIDIASLLGLRKEDVGHAGLKDKHAVSTQTFSILMPGEEEREVAKLVESSLGVEVNWAKRHPKKLRSGHLKGNTFNITITDLEVDPETALRRAECIQKTVARLGIPNYFGTQRIGKDGDNVIDGYDLITGRFRERNRWLRRFLVSSFLSHLCNRYLAGRVESGNFTRILRGDLAKKHDTGGVFTVEDEAVEQPRFDAGEISFTAPIYGYKMREAKYEAKEMEDAVFSGAGVTLDQLRKLGADGTRRLGRLLPDISVAPHDEGVTLSFTLPAGGYATIILREFMKNDDATVEPEAEEPDEDEEQ